MTPRWLRWLIGPSDEESEPSPDADVHLATAPDWSTGEMWRGVLESAGVPVVFVGAAGGRIEYAGMPRLRVRYRDLERARELLNLDEGA